MEDTGTNAYDDITVKKIDGDLKVTEEDNNNSGWGWFVTFKNDSDDKHLESHRWYTCMYVRWFILYKKQRIVVEIGCEKEE